MSIHCAGELIHGLVFLPFTKKITASSVAAMTASFKFSSLALFYDYADRKDFPVCEICMFMYMYIITEILR